MLKFLGKTSFACTAHTHLVIFTYLLRIKVENVIFCANSAHWRKIPYRLWKLKCDFRQIPVLPERESEKYHKNQAKSYGLPWLLENFWLSQQEKWRRCKKIRWPNHFSNEKVNFPILIHNLSRFFSPTGSLFLFHTVKTESRQQKITL